MMAGGRHEEKESGSLRTVDDFLIPAGTGQGFEVRRGQRLQVVAEEGPQAADLVAFNAHDLAETLSTWLTRHMSGSFGHAERVYTALPDANLMFEIVDRPPGTLWLSPGRCNRLTYAQRAPGHANCQDILARTIGQWGLSERDVPEVLNLFMSAVFEPDGAYRFEPSPVKPGEYVELRAHMDCLVAVSACPDDLSAYNEFRIRPIRIRILEDEDAAR